MLEYLRTLLFWGENSNRKRLKKTEMYFRPRMPRHILNQAVRIPFRVTSLGLYNSISLSFIGRLFACDTETDRVRTTQTVTIPGPHTVAGQLITPHVLTHYVYISTGRVDQNKPQIGLWVTLFLTADRLFRDNDVKFNRLPFVKFAVNFN